MRAQNWELTRREALARAGAVAAGAGVLGTGDALARTRRRRTRPHPSGASAVEVLGTELEYYRSDPAHLEARLAQCVAAGYNTIQTYVPWNVHESTRGRLDFTGQSHPVIVNDHLDEYQIETPDQEVAAAGLPSRVIANTNLVSFVAACSRHGLKVLLRPGPFISDEWRNGGLPDWLLFAYPNMFQLGPQGTSLEPGFPFSPPASSVTGGGPLYYFSGPSYASSDYLREVRRWMTAFAAWVKPHLATNGGPVIALQVDDEICFYYRFGPFEVDYHPEMLARFRLEAPGTAAPTDWPPPGGPPQALLPALRWQRFKARQLGVFLGELAGALRTGGANVPITHEHEHQLSPPANFAQLASVLDYLHPEVYLDPGPWSQPTIELCAAAIRAAQRNRRTLICDEMSMDDTLVRHLLIGEGIAGFLGFSYTQGITDDAVGAMHTFTRAVRLAGSRLTRFERVADAGIVWCPEHLYAPYDSTRYGFARDVRNLAERDAPALATLLIRSGISFDLIDTDAAEPADYHHYPSVWLPACDVLPRSCQDALVGYVRAGGRLICWPAPPTLDEDYAPCTILRDALYDESLAAFYPADGQTISVLGTGVTAWRGVQTFDLRPGTRAVAWRGDGACGYSRGHGKGTAILLGTWPAADSIPGREGDVFEIQPVASGTGGSGPSAAEIARALAAKHWNSSIAAHLDLTSPPGAGSPQQVIVFDYSNERRGGEVLTGGTIAYWDGENVVPIADINAGTPTPALTTPPFRPIEPGHLAMARALQGEPPTCLVSDHRLQARLLVAGQGGGATISVVNRYTVDVQGTVTVKLGARRIELAVKLPAGEAMLLALGWTLHPGVVISHATVQLLDAEVSGSQLSLSLESPAGGELVAELPQPVRAATLDDRPAAARRAGRTVRLSLPAGEHELRLRWG